LPPPKLYTKSEIKSLQKQKANTITLILALKPRNDDDENDNDDQHNQNHKNKNNAIYEATRLCTVLYATALANKTPLSSTVRNNFISSSDDDDDKNNNILTLIRHHLSRTDLSNCWDSMVGILFFNTLIAAAACNDTCNDTDTDADTDTENTAKPAKDASSGMAAQVQASRKWFVALAIRCSILLSFSHTDVVVDMLSLVLDVQAVLRGAD
jgi:hypothetical protein